MSHLIIDNIDMIDMIVITLVIIETGSKDPITPYIDIKVGNTAISNTAGNKPINPKTAPILVFLKFTGNVDELITIVPHPIDAIMYTGNNANNE